MNLVTHLTHVNIQTFEFLVPSFCLTFRFFFDRASLTQSLSIVLETEYEHHKKDMTKTEKCLSDQMSSSPSAFQIIEEVNGMEATKSCCQKLSILLILFLTSLVPTNLPTFLDIYSDISLGLIYYEHKENIRKMIPLVIFL